MKAFNSESRYLDDLLNIDNPYFEGMINQIYDDPDLKLFILVGWDRSFRLLLGPPGLN